MEQNDYKNQNLEAAGDTQKGTEAEAQELTFEQALKALENVVSGLQRSDLSLDKSMYLFQEGTRLVTLCRRHLDEAEQEVKVLLRQAGAETEEKDFPTDDREA